MEDYEGWVCDACGKAQDYMGLCEDCAMDAAFCTHCSGTGEGQSDGARCCDCGGRGYLAPTPDFDEPDIDWGIYER